MSDAAAEDGFGMVELLVAMAITSFVVVAAGGLLTIAFGIRERVDDNSAAQSALIDLQGFARLTASEVGFAIHAAGEDGFVLVRSQPAVEWAIELRDGHEIALRRVDRTNSVNLAAFDAAALEYLASTSSRVSWVGASRLGAATPVAARLRLQHNQRIWRPLLWIAPAIEGSRQ